MTRKRKTESDLIEANFASNEYARNKKATMTQGINLALIVLVSALPVLFEKAFLIAMKAEAKTI